MALLEKSHRLKHEEAVLAEVVCLFLFHRNQWKIAIPPVSHMINSHM